MINYEVSLCYEGNELVLTQTLPDGERDIRTIDLKEVSDIENRCKNTSWHTSFDSSREIGESIFNLLNGDRQLLVRALKEADNLGETLSLFVQSDIDIPFELLYSSNFLVPSRIHCIRKVSDYGCKRKIEPKNRPLRVLFMACSPEGISVLDFEKEEETILKITENLPVDIDVEDTGSLEGLYDQLKTNEFDVIHITGHAGIDEEPFFCMEDDTGELAKVRPSELFKVLALNPPRLLFLSGCRTGEPPRAHVSFAQSLVLEHFPSVLSWGLPVTDEGATRAAANLYFELSRGNPITEAVFSARKELFEKEWSDWSLLRLFSDGTPLIEPLVEKGQKWKPRERDLRYRFLEHSQVKVLDKGFIGRRRQIQRGFKCLKKDSKKVGVLLHGTGGLGKSCLAGKLCERFKDHTLIVVHGRLDSVTFVEALKDAFIRRNDKNGLEILKEDEELPLKILRLCSTSFKENPYLIVMDDFEKNLEVKETPLMSPEAVSILETLLEYLFYAGKMSQLIITSRYTFPLTVKGKDIVEDQLGLIGLTSFKGADERKKVSELRRIANYPDLNVRQKLISAGRGNPRLLEILNTLLEEQKNLDVLSLLKEVRGKKEEFVEELFLRRLLEGQSADFVKVIQRLAVYRLPVTEEAIELICKGMIWEPLVEKGVQISLIEEDKKGSTSYYWVTPLLREELSAKCGTDERQLCHKAA
ncbi:MAG: CHAT domain-containing protein, partial [Theionarchaea archaeon]|nr:CHAT domain-containing protein [Theionarchaea archaeon]